jgi:pimeloyl-ACP methyl ester carboxylesterase
MATLGQMAQAVGPEAFVRQQTAIIGRVDSRPFLPRIACPTLVLAGREDVIMPLAVLEEMAGAIPGARLVVVEDCAHVAMLEQPEAVTDALYLWLAGEPRKGPDVVAGTRRPPPA